jgi:hypothetical protein
MRIILLYIFLGNARVSVTFFLYGVRREFLNKGGLV